MAAPAAVVAVKAVLATAADKRTRTAVLSVAAALLVPFILIMTVILCTLSGAADHNTSAVNTAFHGGYLSSKVPGEYRMYIEKMQDSFLNLDQAIAEINDMAENESLDADQVKSVFYSLFYGADQPRMSMEEYRKFADCFVTYEEREDEEGNSYTVAVPVHDLQTVYFNLNSVFGISVAMETQINANRIYTLVKYGQALPGGNGMLPGEAMGDGSFAALMAEATKYIGWPYVWGGSSPATSFDCSGYICWVYTKSGVYNLPRTTAQGIFNQCAVIPKEEAKPGDLIFFTGTYASASPVSHVGIYVGGNQMLHCGSPIGYANIDSAYWSGHFYAMGRLPGGGAYESNL